MQEAMKRHERKEARVIPIIIHPCLWEAPPLDKLQLLRDDAKSIARWTHRDEGFTSMAKGIARVVELWNTCSLPGPVAEREALMAHLDQLIETVKSQMQPPPRAMATANTLQQLSIF